MLILRCSKGGAGPATRTNSEFECATMAEEQIQRQDTIDIRSRSGF